MQSSVFWTKTRKQLIAPYEKANQPPRSWARLEVKMQGLWRHGGLTFCSGSVTVWGQTNHSASVSVWCRSFLLIKVNLYFSFEEQLFIKLSAWLLFTLENVSDTWVLGLKLKMCEKPHSREASNTILFTCQHSCF